MVNFLFYRDYESKERGYLQAVHKIRHLEHAISHKYSGGADISNIRLEHHGAHPITNRDVFKVIDCNNNVIGMLELLK